MPLEDEPKMLQLTQELFGSSEPDPQRQPAGETPEERRAQQQAAMMEFFVYFNTLIEARRADPPAGCCQRDFQCRDQRRTDSIMDAMALFPAAGNRGS